MSLVVENLTFSYGDANALAGVSFSIPERVHTAVLGPSGSGKSTLLKLIAGFDPPLSGRISLNGQLLSDASHVLIPPHKRGLAMLFQDLALWPNLSAFNNVSLGLTGADVDAKTKSDRTMEALRFCGLEALARRKPAALSMGQQQRVALARALVVRPTLLLLDEPFSSLDLVLKRRLFSEISSLVRQFETTLLMVTHDPADALALCTNALVLQDGRTCEQGELQQLLQKPQSELLRQFAQDTRHICT
jgi:ABC-type Fe3+/spermidine/putrescine transport system ATPase subunit